METKLTKQVCQRWLEIDKISQDLCHDNCRWYHSSWCLLKCLDLVAGAVLFYKFYHQQIGSLTVKRVAVVGTAGISTPVLLSELQAKATLDVIDICPTPLKACEMYANEHSLKWNFIQKNMMEGFEPIALYDLVVNDAFLTLFRDVDKSTILQNIAKILKPKGHYITTLRKGSFEGEVRKSGKETRDRFINNALNRSQKLFPELKGFVEKKAMEYTHNITNYPIDSIENVTKFFESNGFKIIYIDETEIFGESGYTTYFQVVAEKIGKEKMSKSSQVWKDDNSDFLTIHLE